MLRYDFSCAKLSCNILKNILNLFTTPVCYHMYLLTKKIITTSRVCPSRHVRLAAIIYDSSYDIQTGRNACHKAREKGFA